MQVGIPYLPHIAANCGRFAQGERQSGPICVDFVGTTPSTFDSFIGFLVSFGFLFPINITSTNARALQREKIVYFQVYLK